ncbi:MAG: PadR family transcriptional regulator [Promethearchaeota archaeon]
MVENIVNKFEKTMKKGFVNIFVLLALNKEPTYGYQIKKLIEDRTFGFWSPSDSTMYTILNNLREKGLIRQSDIQDSDDTRKVYELTEKGKETLEVMTQREREMRESMRSIIFSTSEINNDFLEDSFQDFIFRGPKSGISPMHGHSMKGSFMSPFKGDFMGILNHKSKEDQIKLLNTGKKFIAEKIQNFTQILKNIDEKISDLESETKSK